MCLSLTNEIKPHVIVVYNHLIVAVMSESCVKPGLSAGTLANCADPDQMPQSGI